ncbi:MAG: low molecular weight protein arginine phosphatase [Puniceicoccales bacterium]
MSGQPTIITVVCTANICRSPMAAGLLRHALNGEVNPPPFVVDSAGVAARDGDPASRNSVVAMKKVGIDLKDHQSRMLTPERLARSTVIFCMTSDHKRMIETLFPRKVPFLCLFRDFAESGSSEVPDPFGGSLDEYIQCRDSLLDAIPGILRFLYQEVFPSSRS